MPRELSHEQNILLVQEYVKSNFVSVGMCADVCVHDKNDGAVNRTQSSGGKCLALSDGFDRGAVSEIKDFDSSPNPHAHIMLTMRPFNPDKSWGAKQRKEYILDDNGEKIYDKKKRQYKCNSIPSTDWNDQSKAEEWRSAWAESCNKYLELANSEQRIDHRSYARQGKDQIPTIHLGAAAHQLEKRGIRTSRGDRNREIEISNQRLRQLKARIAKLADDCEFLQKQQKSYAPALFGYDFAQNSKVKSQMQNWVDKEIENPTPPTFTEVIQNILDKKGVYNLQKAAKMFNFLTENNIQNFDELDEKLKEVVYRHYDIQREFKPIDRRLNTLEEHLQQSDSYFKFKKFNDELRAIKKPKLQEKYRAEYRQKLSQFKSAKSYLDGVMNGRTQIPTKMWKEEFAKLTTEKSALNEKYQQLTDEVNEVTRIRSNVNALLKSEQSQHLQGEVAQSSKVQATAAKSELPMSMKDRLARAKKQADEYNASRTQMPKLKAYKDKGGR